MAKRIYGKYSGKSPTEKLTDARQALFDALLADMEREGSRWVKEWSFPHPPMNGVTGEGYSPRNTAMLMYAMRDGGFRDPRFATFKMATDKGCHITTDYLVEDCFIPKLGKDYFKSIELATQAVADVDMERGGEVEQGDDGYSLDDLCASKCEEADIANGGERDEVTAARYEEGR